MRSKPFRFLLLFSLLLLRPTAAAENGRLEKEQLRYPRVRAAAAEKESVLRERFRSRNLAFPPRAILLRAFKKEGQLELWAERTPRGAFVLVHTYGICATSGVLGPKRRAGDQQVPEGFYDLDWFNPQSNFHLSMHISYPNPADRILKTGENPGGDIFLHGDCVTIGCIPVTDAGIEELYWLAIRVKSGGAARLPIEIYPARLDPEGWRALYRSRADHPALLAFWKNLKDGYDYFEKHRRPPAVAVHTDGSYGFPDRP